MTGVEDGRCDIPQAAKSNITKVLGRELLPRSLLRDFHHFCQKMKVDGLLPAIGIIPARWASARLPGKVLADLGGKPLVQHVWEKARASHLSRVVIATDSPEVAQAASGFGAEVVMTAQHHPNGSARCMEAFEKLDGGKQFPLLFNIQGDEPFLSPTAINSLMEFMARKPHAVIGTTYHTQTMTPHTGSESVVKLVTDADDRVLYFSRAAIPHRRSDVGINPVYKIHTGIYAFRTAHLYQLKKLPESRLELIECLEQLRWLYHGIPVYALETPGGSFSVDTSEDLERARKMYFHSPNTP